MDLFADTSVWSLAMRRDDPDDVRAAVLIEALRGRHAIFGTGVVLQELLQGVRGARLRPEIIRRFRYVNVVRPTLDDHVGAADLRNTCRRGGVRGDTIDALLAALCIRRGLVMLTADRDFEHLAQHVPLELWEPAAS